MPATVMTPEQFEQWLQRTFTAAAESATKPVQLRALAVKARADIQGFFQSSISPEGNPWAPLKFPRIRGGDKPLLDTGRLRASFVGDVLPDGVKVSTNHPQAGILNDGGTIRAKKKFLAIPLTRKAQLAGSPLRFGKPLVFRGNANKGAWMEAKGRGKNKTLVAQYALVKQVTIPARPFLGFSDSYLDFAEKQIADLMAQQFMR